MTPDEVFEYAMGVVLNAEGVLSLDPEDRGNWTGGAKGVGELKGTKFGVSAASYPDLDIAALTWEAAKEIYRRDYWEAIRAYVLPPALAVVAVDIAINSGPGYVRAWMSERPHDAVTLTARRMRHYTDLDDWPLYGRGWSRRAYAVLEAAHALTARPGVTA